MKTIMITPFLNEEAVIGDLIKSVISQQLKPAKWVLVDDGSTDKSLQIIQELAKDYEGKAVVGKVNVDQNPEVAGKYGIRSIPTILFIKNGEVVDKSVGAVPKTALSSKLDAQL